MNFFGQYMKHFSHIEGWFQVPAIVTWDCLLDYQEGEKIAGNLLELGVWKGKAAALLALHCRPGERCLFVDPSPLLMQAKENIDRVIPGTNCQYLQETSQGLQRRSLLTAMAGTFRWIHIDAEHTVQGVMRDLAIADRLVGDRGIVTLDDFLTPAYPQVTQAIFQFLTTQPGRFSLVLCGHDKGYLCRPMAAREYLTYCRSLLYEEMSKRGCDQVTIWKTTEPADMNTFGITNKEDYAGYRGLDWDKSTIRI